LFGVKTPFSAVSKKVFEQVIKNQKKVKEKKNLVNFSCTSRHRDSGMLLSFERRFDFF